MPIDFQRTDNVKRAASYNTATLQKYDFAAKCVYTADDAKFRFKFIRRYVANFIKFMRTAINFILKFLHRRACKHIRIAKHAVNVLRYETCLHKTQRAKQLCAACDTTVFNVQREQSRRKSVAANDNLSTLRIDLQSMKSFCQCTHAASQVRSNFFRLRSRKTFHIGKARFKIQVHCGKF